MREARENIRSSQLDLFAWRERDGDSAETVGRGGRPRDAPRPNRIEPLDVGRKLGKRCSVPSKRD